eukprot:maker-scaffold182_size278544-snap-gene-0.12 protein:Tk04803 transcript:maker-scaffold182_size278544-snap-gene-0.12-mRNA-1 annotation:"fmrfamide receptor"
MVTWWRETDDYLLALLKQPLAPTNDSSLDFMDQVEWTSMARFYNNTDLDPNPIGLLPIHHANFSSIVRSVVDRNPNVTFRYYDYDITNQTVQEALADQGVSGPRLDSQRCPGTQGATVRELAKVKVVGFVLDVMCQSSLGILGILGNLLAIYILVRGKKLQSNFNKILTCLLAVHTTYIINSLTLEIYKQTGGIPFDIIFSNVLYPCKSMLLYTSTFLTLFMARERYLAVRYPIQYRNASIVGNRWRTAFSNLALCLSLSAAFVVPLIFESEVKVTQIRSVKVFNETHSLERITHHHEVRVTDLRVDRNYVFWYKNIATFTFTVAIPLGLLLFWNAHTIRYMRRRQIEGQAQPHNPHHPPVQAFKLEEANKIRILFVIILLFFVCNTLRFFLIFEECIANRDHKFAEEHRCVAIPFWALIINRVSQLLLTVNASLGSFVYCVMSMEFRMEVIGSIKSIRRWARRGSHKSSEDVASEMSRLKSPIQMMSPDKSGRLDNNNPAQSERLTSFHHSSNSLFFENRSSSVKVNRRTNPDSTPTSSRSIKCEIALTHFGSEPKTVGQTLTRPSPVHDKSRVISLEQRQKAVDLFAKDSFNTKKLSGISLGT